MADDDEPTITTTGSFESADPIPGAEDRGEWESGRMVARRYVLDRKLGGGSTGEVWLAEDRLLRKPVALKVLRNELAQNRDTVRRFLREVALAHSVTNRNVVRIYDTGEQAGLPFFTMEYLQGKTLEELLGDPHKKKGVSERMRFDEIRAIALDVLDAMRAAHRVGVVHRDLKPGNVMLTHRGAIVMDFGVAGVEEVADPKPSSSAAGVRSLVRTETGTIFGSPAYMAPELWEGEPASVQSDLYAFGVMLYQMVSGRLPYEASTPASYLAQVNAGPPTPLRHLRRDTPWTLVRLIHRCMAHEPEHRPASAEAAANLFSPLRSEYRRRLVTAGLLVGSLALALVVLLRLRPEHEGMGLRTQDALGPVVAAVQLWDSGETPAALRQLDRIAERTPHAAAVGFWRATLAAELGNETRRQEACAVETWRGDDTWIELAQAACSPDGYRLPEATLEALDEPDAEWPHAALAPLAVQYHLLPALESAPSDHEAIRTRARAVLERLGRGPDDDDPLDLRTRRALARVDLELALGRTAEARQRLSDMVEEQAETPAVLAHAAWLATITGDLERGTELAHRVRPVDPRPWLSLQMRQGKLTETWRDIEDHKTSSHYEGLRRLWCGYAWRFDVRPRPAQCSELPPGLAAAVWASSDEPIAALPSELQRAIAQTQRSRALGECAPIDPGPALTHATTPFELRQIELAIEAALCPENPDHADLGRAQTLASQLVSVAPSDPWALLLFSRVDDARGEESQATARRLAVAELWRDADDSLPLVSRLVQSVDAERTARRP